MVAVQINENLFKNSCVVVMSRHAGTMLLQIIVCVACRASQIRQIVRIALIYLYQIVHPIRNLASGMSKTESKFLKSGCIDRWACNAEIITSRNGL